MFKYRVVFYIAFILLISGCNNITGADFSQRNLYINDISVAPDEKNIFYTLQYNYNYDYNNISNWIYNSQNKKNSILHTDQLITNPTWEDNNNLRFWKKDTSGNRYDTKLNITSKAQNNIYSTNIHPDSNMYITNDNIITLEKNVLKSKDIKTGETEVLFTFNNPSIKLIPRLSYDYKKILLIASYKNSSRNPCNLMKDSNMFTIKTSLPPLDVCTSYFVYDFENKSVSEIYFHNYIGLSSDSYPDATFSLDNKHLALVDKRVNKISIVNIDSKEVVNKIENIPSINSFKWLDSDKFAYTTYDYNTSNSQISLYNFKTKESKSFSLDQFVSLHYSYDNFIFLLGKDKRSSNLQVIDLKDNSLKNIKDFEADFVYMDYEITLKKIIVGEVVSKENMINIYIFSDNKLELYKTIKIGENI